MIVHYHKPASLFRLSVASALLLLHTLDGNAQAPDPIEEARETTRDLLLTENLGAGYAAFIGFALTPAISAATYNPDSASEVNDPTIDVYRLPARFAFGPESAAVRPFLQPTLAYQQIDAEFLFAPENSIDSTWEKSSAVR